MAATLMDPMGWRTQPTFYAVASLFMHSGPLTPHAFCCNMEYLNHKSEAVLRMEKLGSVAAVVSPPAGGASLILVGVLACALLLIPYTSVIRGLFAQWANDPDQAHAFAVPFAMGWMVWRNKDTLGRTPAGWSWWAMPFLILGALLHYLSEAGLGLFVGSLAMCASAVGLILALGGAKVLRCLAFPFSLVVFMLPKLAVVHNQVTLPMQLLATSLAHHFLQFGGIPVQRMGNVLALHGKTYNVIEACSGFRYLIALVFLTTVFGQVWESRPWWRVGLVAFCVPVAILANALRVSTAPIIGLFLPSLASDGFHAFVGWAVFMATLAQMGAVYIFLRRALLRFHAG